MRTSEPYCKCGHPTSIHDHTGCLGYTGHKREFGICTCESTPSDFEVSSTPSPAPKSDQSIIDALAQIDRMRQALNDIRALHRRVVGCDIPEDDHTDDRCDECFDMCEECCSDQDSCYDNHFHNSGEPICPTAAILDRVGL